LLSIQISGYVTLGLSCLIYDVAYLEHDYGIFHVRGGLNRISAAMANVIQEAGGEIHLNVEIQSLVIDQGVVKGVKLQSGEKCLAMK